MDFNEAYDDKNTSVGLAARLGDVVVLKELLQQGCPTNGHDNRGWRPLHEAAAGGHVECVRLLLVAEDAEVDALTHEGLTALHIACEPDECHTEVVKLLLLAGADPNMKCGSDMDLPLPKAVLNNLYDIVKLLLDAGGNPNREDFETGAPLMAAVKKGHLNIARLLIERGAKADFKDDKGRTAIHMLFLSPLKYIKDFTCHLMEDTTLILFIDLMVQGGLDVNVRMSGGSTPLMQAIQREKVAVVSHLLELGADPNIEKGCGLLALHYAIRFWSDFSTERHDGPNSEGKTTDHVLRRILDLTSRELIIPAKSKKKYLSIFHIAIEWEKLNTLKLMVNAGLPPDAFFKQMVSVIGLYCQLCKVRIVIDLGMKVNTPLGLLLSKPLNKKSVEMAKFMIDKGSNVNAVVPRCLPPLVAVVKHQRARYNHGSPGLDILMHLLANGVDVMHKIRATDILPAALHVSSLFNVQAFFALLVRCIPVHEIYNPQTLESLSQLYAKSGYYKVYPLMPWRVISWLNVVNAFVPQLPLDVKNTFDIQSMVEDNNLSRAWDDLDAQIGSPKKLEQLCVLTVRRVVGERRGWNQLTTFLQKLTLLNEPLPDLIIDLLMYKQMESSLLSKWPPHEVLSRYVLSAANSRNAHSDDEDDPSDKDDDDEEEASDEDDDDNDHDHDVDYYFEMMLFYGNNDDDDDDYDTDEDDDDNGKDDDDENCDKDDEKGAEEQIDDSVDEEEEIKRKKMKMENE